MRNFLGLLFTFLTYGSIAFAQLGAPTISTGPAAGLGNYGYLEKDAVTFASLARNTYDNIDFLSARFWVTDNLGGNPPIEYLYHTYEGPDGNWCGSTDGIKRTRDYNPALHFGSEWVAGSDAYVSVFAKYCPAGSGPWGPSTPNGSTPGFNERLFKVIDVSSSTHTSTTNIVGNGNGTCNATKVVGSFVIDPGSATGISLTRLRIRNTGTSLEGTDISNDGFRLYYEPVTGTEVYNNTEPSGGILYGDWSGDSQTNNYYENPTLSIPISGATRVYVLLCNLTSPGFTPNRSVSLEIDNDGLNFAPLKNTSFGLMRNNPITITYGNVILPQRFTHFSGKVNKDHNLLSLSVENLKEHETVVLQKSVNHSNWNSIQAFTSFTQGKLQTSFLDYEQPKQQVYYRLFIQHQVTGDKEYSNILKLESNNNKTGVGIYQEGTTKAIYIESFSYLGTIQLQFFDANGRLLGKRQTIPVSPGQKQLLSMPVQSSTGLYFLRAVMQDGTQQFVKIVQ